MEDLSIILKDLKAAREKLAMHIDYIQDTLNNGRLLDEEYENTIIATWKENISQQKLILESKACQKLTVEGKAESIMLSEVEKAVKEWSEFGHKYAELMALLQDFQHLLGEKAVVQEVAEIAKADSNKISSMSVESAEQASALNTEYGVYKDTAEVISGKKDMGNDRPLKKRILTKFSMDFFFALEEGEVSFAEKQDDSHIEETKMTSETSKDDIKQLEAESRSVLAQITDEQVEENVTTEKITEKQEERSVSDIAPILSEDYDIGKIDFSQGSRYIVNKKSTFKNIKKELNNWPDALRVVGPASEAPRGIIFEKDALNMIREKDIKKDCDEEYLKKST